MFGHLDDDTPTGVSWDEYEPPTEQTVEAAAEEWDRVQDDLAEQRADQIFLAFIQTRFFDKIGRCTRCQKFFLNESGHRNKQFCSSRCARITSAMKSKQRVQGQKLARLQRTAQKFPHATKDALAEKAGVSLHFVTRALNQGLIGPLEPPKEH
jgi:hypothetical protein